MISRATIVAEARAWIGTPYMHAQSVKGVGCDCLGLVRGVWRALYGDEPETLPAYSSSWRDGRDAELLLDAAQRHLEPISSGQPGDVVVFRWRPNLPARHCGILLDDHRMVHAYQSAGSVTEGALGIWGMRIAGVFSFPGVS